jgi:hypothetical protein
MNDRGGTLEIDSEPKQQIENKDVVYAKVQTQLILLIQRLEALEGYLEKRFDIVCKLRGIFGVVEELRLPDEIYKINKIKCTLLLFITAFYQHNYLLQFICTSSPTL